MMKQIARTTLAALALTAVAATTASAQQSSESSQTLSITVEPTHVLQMDGGVVLINVAAAAAGSSTQQGIGSSTYAFATSYSAQAITVALAPEQDPLPTGLKIFVQLESGIGEVEVGSLAQTVRTNVTGAESEKAVSYRVTAPVGTVADGHQVVVVYTLADAV